MRSTPPERVVFTEIFEPFPDGGSVVTRADRGERQDSPYRELVYPSPEVRDLVLNSGMAHGAAISYDRLEEVAQELLQGEV